MNISSSKLIQRSLSSYVQASLKKTSSSFLPFSSLTTSFATHRKHEIWRDDQDADNLPKVKKRDGTVDKLDKTRGFIDYYRNPEPYREPLERIFDWKEIYYESSLIPSENPLNQGLNTSPSSNPLHISTSAPSSSSSSSPSSVMSEPSSPVNTNAASPSSTEKVSKEHIHPEIEKTIQAARCMDCGTPFCQTHTGCPVNNLIPEWNELIYKGQWLDAYHRLSLTNNFPEFTGRVCPAPCEGACVAGLIDSPVTIKTIEYAIIEKAWEEGWVQPRIPKNRTGCSVAVIGSGPSGLAAADCLNQLGHKVTVYEREDRPGGLLLYGIPNMKLEKDTVFRRISLMQEEGIEFITNANIGKDINIHDIKSNHDAIVLAIGSTIPRDLPIPGRHYDGIHFAMEFLTKNQKRLLGLSEGGALRNRYSPLSKKGGSSSSASSPGTLTAEGKDVIIIGGGDTGTDCIGTAIRHRCKSIHNFEVMPRPPNERSAGNPWPQWPRVYGLDYGHSEVMAVFGSDPRQYNVITSEFKGDPVTNKLTAVVTEEVEVDKATNKITKIPGSKKEWPADLIILSMGFIHPEKTIIEQLGLEIDARNNIHASPKEFQTNLEGIFAAGDCRRGQSLVVWAIHEGRGAATKCHEYLQRHVMNQQEANHGENHHPNYYQQ